MNKYPNIKNINHKICSILIETAIPWETILSDIPLSVLSYVHKINCSVFLS